MFKFRDEKTQTVMGIIIFGLLVGLLGMYIAQDITSRGSIEEPNKIGDGSIKALVDSGDAKIKEIPVDLDLNADTVARPKLGRAVVFPDRFTSEAIEILVGNITTLTTRLKEDPDSFEDWFKLAIQYKVIDDFEGAIEIWKYLSLVTEGDTTSRINLGNVYHYNLKEYQKSEAVFKEAIGIDSEAVGAYTGLHELYKYSYKTETTLAIDILKDGIVAIPENIDIRMLLALYYTKIDMKEEALAVYEEILVLADTAGNINLVTIIESAIENLK